MRSTIRTLVTATLLVGFTAGDIASFSFSPAAAEAGWRDRRYRHHDNLDAGDVIAGLAIFAGVAAIASAAANSSDGWNDRSSFREDEAVDACRFEAERQARSYGASAAVRDIYDVDRRGSSYRVRGLVEISLGEPRPDETSRGTTERFTCVANRGSVSSYQLGGYAGF